jgi:hypothetical protein
MASEVTRLCVERWCGLIKSVSGDGLVQNAHGSSTLRVCWPATR